MNVTLVTSTYNKNEALRNTLTGIQRQKTSFPLNVVIVDDGSKVSPEPIIREILPNAIFYRFEKNQGFKPASLKCYELSPPDTDVFVTLSADVMIIDDDAVEKLVNTTDERHVSIGEVLNLKVDPNLYKEWGSGISAIKGNWEDHNVYFGIYCGHEKPTRWYLFLGALHRSIIEDIEFFGKCDVVYRRFLKRRKYEVNFPLVKSVHQEHPPLLGYCPEWETCGYACPRTKERERKKEEARKKAQNG